MSHHFSTGGGLLSCDIGKHNQAFLRPKHTMLFTRTDICPESHKHSSQRKHRERWNVGHYFRWAMCESNNRSTDDRTDLNPNVGNQTIYNVNQCPTRIADQKLSLPRPPPPAFSKPTSQPSASPPHLRPARPHSSSQPPPHPRHLCLLPSLLPTRAQNETFSISCYASCTKLILSQRSIGAFSTSPSPTLPSASHHTWLGKTRSATRKRDQLG